MSEKCPELVGSEKLSLGAQVAKMACEFKKAPAPKEIAEGIVKSNDGALTKTAKTLGNRGNQIEKALADAGA